MQGESYIRVNGGIATVLILAFGLVGCQPAPEIEGEADTARWYKGNLHTHSLWSDGDDYPEVIIDWYRENGYDFIALSDHNTIADGEKWITVGDNPQRKAAYEAYVERFGDEWVVDTLDGAERRVRLKTFDEYRSLLEQPGRFLIVRSEEISDGFESKPVHINATNIKEHIKPQGGGSVLEVMQNNVNAVLDQRARTGQAMFPHLNHPNFVWAVTAEDMIALEGERFFEVYNGHPLVHNEGDHDHPGTERMWDIVLTQRLAQGRPVLFGLATDDSHHYHQYDSTRSNPGRGWVMVRATELTPEAIIAAMEAGDFYGTSGVLLDDIEQNDDQIAIRIRPEPGVRYVTRFIGTRQGYDSTSTAVLPKSGERVTRRYSDDIGVVLAEVEGTEPVYQVQGDELYVRVNVVSSKPKANAVHAGEVEEAWVQPYVPGRSAERDAPGNQER